MTAPTTPPTPQNLLELLKGMGVPAGIAVALVALVVSILAFVNGGGGGTTPPTTTTIPVTTSTTVPGGGPPTVPPAPICGNTALLTGPAAAPTGAVTVPAGNNSTLAPVPNTTYWFAPGVHTLGTGQFAQIVPAAGDAFLGGPGAILDGGGVNNTAFGQAAAGVRIAYLTIRNFDPPGSQSAVNHDGGPGWTIDHDTITLNSPGAGLGIGSHNSVTYDCLSANGEYGFNAYTVNAADPVTGGPTAVTLDHDEIAGNDTYNWEVKSPGCGCSGGGKFWRANGITVTNSWIHDNAGGAGLWADTNDTAQTYTADLFANNYGPGLEVEISYNATIQGDTFTGNALGAGPANPGFPEGAIYLSESGGDTRAPGNGTGTIDISANNFTGNWAGVVEWENADRFCNSPANSSGGVCTLVNPAATLTTCAQPGIATAPLYSDCRWRTQNVKVHANTFVAASPLVCTATAGDCNMSGVFSNYGTFPTWSPYQGTVIEQAITFNQANVWSANRYQGAWRFIAHDQGVTLTPAAWQAAPYAQDAGSTFTP